MLLSFFVFYYSVFTLYFFSHVNSKITILQVPSKKTVYNFAHQAAPLFHVLRTGALHLLHVYMCLVN